VLVQPMLDETMTIEIEKVGTLACLNSDGLRTLLRTTDIPDMFEKTLRYPKHVDQMRTLMEAGLFSTNPVMADGTLVRPIDLTANVLSPLWKYEPGEADLTVMKLIISGIENGQSATYTYEMCDEYDPATGALSMARTTGYTCNAVTQLVLDGSYSQKGISAPEFVGRVEGCWESVKGYLEDRGINIHRKP